MSKITNDGLTRSGTGCFIALPNGRQRVNSSVNLHGGLQTLVAILIAYGSDRVSRSEDGAAAAVLVRVVGGVDARLFAVDVELSVQVVPAV